MHPEQTFNQAFETYYTHLKNPPKESDYDSHREYLIAFAAWRTKEFELAANLLTAGEEARANGNG